MPAPRTTPRQWPRKSSKFCPSLPVDAKNTPTTRGKLPRVVEWFFTAAALINKLEDAHQHHQLDLVLAQLDRAELLFVDELGYLSFTRTGAELLFQVFAERYERRSLLLTSNLAFSEWGQVFQSERMTAALLDRLTHRCHIFEMQGESYRFREAMKEKGKRKAK